MKKGLFILILCLSIMLIGCPAATSNDANDANGTNTGSNDGNGNGGSGNNGGSGTGNTGNTGVITSVENEFVYYDNEKECYVGSVTWKAESPQAQALINSVDGMKLYLYDANGKERAYIPMTIEADINEMSITGTIPSNTLAKVDNEVYWQDYGDYITMSESVRVYDIPGITVKAKLLYKDEINRAPDMIKTQTGLISKGTDQNWFRDAQQFESEFITNTILEDGTMLKYSFNWLKFYKETGIFPLKVSLNTVGVSSNVTNIDWSSDEVLNNYFNDLSDSASVQIGNFYVKIIGTGKYEENHEGESQYEIKTYMLYGDKQKELTEQDKIYLTVVSTIGKTYKFMTYQYGGYIYYDTNHWSYKE